MFIPRSVIACFVGGGAIIWRFATLKPGRSHIVRFQLLANRTTTGRHCTTTGAQARLRRLSSATICTVVASAARPSPPSFTG
jgi:hypothetical protein